MRAVALGPKERSGPCARIPQPAVLSSTAYAGVSEDWPGLGREEAVQVRWDDHEGTAKEVNAGNRRAGFGLALDLSTVANMESRQPQAKCDSSFRSHHYASQNSPQFSLSSPQFLAELTRKTQEPSLLPCDARVVKEAPSLSPHLLAQSPQDKWQIQQQQQQQLNQQQVQQAQQQQQDPHSSISGFGDQGRMWSQIQHMQQFRSGGGDMNSQQANAQMLDLIRSQNLARVQGQQQQQQLNNQQFGLGGQQMAGMGGGAGNGQQQPQTQPFLESSSNQSQPANMSPAFPGAGLPNAPAMQPSMSRNAMMQAFGANASQAGHTNPSVTRQLELMLAQNQPQNSPINLAQRLEHQRQQQQQQVQHQQHQQQISMNQSSPGELFAPGMVDRRPSPAHPNIQGPNAIGGGPTPQQQHPQQPQRRLNVNELTERATILRNHIQAQEAMFTQFSAQRPMSPDPNYVNKMRALSSEIKQKKDYLAKMTQAMQAMGSMGNGPQTWTFSPNANNTMGHAQPQNQPQPGQNNIQPSPSNMHAQIQQGNHLLPQGMVARPTSGQQHTTPGGPGGPSAGRSFSNQMSPNMNPQFSFSANNNNGNPSSSPSMGPPGVQTTPSGNMQLPPPLEKNRFESAYKSYSATKGVKLEPRLMNVDGREIDLYLLHTHVMQEGGWSKVHNMELWNVIGGRMGFVQFPGTDSEPAKSGPGVAQRLAQVYQEYLSGFDQVYINSVIESRRQMQAAAAVQAQAAAAAGGNGGPSQTQPQPRGLLNAHQMQVVIGYANQSVEELRRQGVQEKIIQFVETNRAHLQRTVMEQGIFRGQFKNQGIRPPDQHGVQGGVTGTPFQGAGGHQNSAPAGGQNLSYMQRQNGLLPMRGINFMDNRQPPVPQQPHPHPHNGNTMIRATKEQAMAFIQKTKGDFQSNTLPTMRGVEVPIDQRAEFNNLLQQLQRFAREIDSKLPTYFFVLKSEDLIRKLIAIILTVNQQQAFLSTPNPRYIVGVDILRNMMAQVNNANNAFQAYLAAQINRNPQSQQGPQQPPHLLPPGSGMPPNSHVITDMTRPPSQSIPQQIPQPLAPPNRPPVALRPPPIIHKATTSTPGTTTAPAVSTPTPPTYSASTPVASAPTPTQTASSPQAPKSPKGKAPMKPKNPPKRRPSVKNPPTPGSILPTTDQAQTPGSSTGGNVKRQREEDTLNPFGASPNVNEPSPPKRVKTEWEGPPSDVLKKKAEAVENVKTEEDASAFLEQMTELIKMAGEGQESLSSDISETLDMILKGYGTVPEGPEAALGLSSLGGLGESSMPSSSTKPPADEFVEFFDFSSFGTLDEDNDDDSKAPTPELVSSSSTNPSPESGSEADAAHHALLSSTEPKTEELPDLLRLGPWKEIDGGESAYYQSGDWKWDSPMPAQEQPWAIFTS
ncbi:hypothetical protein D9615_004211 [Tricholomella constricta]|uniref:ARID domain-containing protein n=1 Tax=Tricholomella constricta TaxID=117010 RepID=A0A8H5HEZ7_9AGAR|nr:hypothetical protein D9615_004211 [Tricholomella constricta]